jgi:hypothetical protein
MRIVVESVLMMVVAVALAAIGARLVGGGPEGLAVSALVAIVALALVAIRVANGLRRTAARAGYGSIGEYLRAVPRSDEERQHAVDLALKGLVWCLAGLLVPPLILVGIFPLYYGTRKVVYASMGLGLVDDADPPAA